MENWIYADGVVIGKTVASCLIIFVSIIVITRLAGLRTFAKMSSFDFASTIAIGSILASVVMNGGQSLLKGVVALGTIVLLQGVYSMLNRRCKLFSEVSQNEPVLLMRDGEIFDDALAATNVSRADLMAKLREANVLQMSQVRAVVFEITGDVSVLHGKEGALEAEILSGVRVPPNED